MINKKQIINTIKLKFNITDIELVKIEGFWYWSGEITEKWQSKCTYYPNIKNTSLENWIQDFKEKNKNNF